MLTENAAILQYLGDLSGNASLFPPVGELRRFIREQRLISQPVVGRPKAV